MLMSFFEILRNTTHVGHTRSLFHRKKEASFTAEEREGDSAVETAHAALAWESDIDLEETDE